MPLILKKTLTNPDDNRPAKPPVPAATWSAGPSKEPIKARALADLPQILTENEVAIYLGITAKQMTRLRYDKKGPKTFKLGSHHRIRRDDLNVWIGEHTAK